MNSATEEVATKKELGMNKEKSLFSAGSLRIASIATVIYLVLSYWLIGFKTDQLVLVGIFNIFYFSSWTTRRFILGFSIFIIYWIVFDYMKAFPNYRYNAVHIQDLYHWERTWFGFEWNQSIITPNEYFAKNATTFLDILAGIFYLCWIPVPLIFAGIMFFKNRSLFFQFSLTFFLVNLIGFVGYYTYPAAPPWYVAQYGFDFISTTPGNTAGLASFDTFFGIRVFESIYAKSSNVFAAMPSLHAAYMMIVVFYAVKAGMKGWILLFAIIMVGIWFAAIYSSHHYVLDVLAGIISALLGIIFFQLWARSGAGQTKLAKLVKLISK